MFLFFICRIHQSDLSNIRCFLSLWCLFFFWFIAEFQQILIIYTSYLYWVSTQWIMYICMSNTSFYSISLRHSTCGLTLGTTSKHVEYVSHFQNGVNKLYFKSLVIFSTYNFCHCSPSFCAETRRRVTQFIGKKRYKKKQFLILISERNLLILFLLHMYIHTYLHNKRSCVITFVYTKMYI